MAGKKRRCPEPGQETLSGPLPRAPWRKKILKYLGIFTVTALILTVLVLEIFSRGAARIFNYAVSQQDMLRGTITVEKLLADLTGHVRFENLEWQDVNGHTILRIPRGTFDVRLWDVVTGNLKATTVQKLTLSDAAISVHLDKEMRVDFIRQSPEVIRLGENPAEDWEQEISLAGKSEEELKEIGERRRRMRQRYLERQLANFNRADRRIKLQLMLDKCRIEVFHKERHYLFNPVRVNADINTDGLTHVRVSTGAFGGTMVGSGLSLHGDIDFRANPAPECDLSMMLYEVDPSSLGFGVKISDRMTLQAHFTGPVARPVGRGTVKMDELNIPALRFTDVLGSIYYEDALLQFSDVSAAVYGGRFLASGEYNIDTRYYRLDGHGAALQADKALPGSRLTCAVELDIHMESKGSPQQTICYGSFRSGDGHYHLLPFAWLSGEFYNTYHNLRFSALNIQMAAFRISTDALAIKDGKLTMKEIRLTDEEGNLLREWEPPARRDDDDE